MGMAWRTWFEPTSAEGRKTSHAVRVRSGKLPTRYMKIKMVKRGRKEKSTHEWMTGNEGIKPGYYKKA